MKKILSITIISALSLVLSSGCASKTEAKPAAKPAYVDAKVSKDALYVDLSNKQILNVIKKAGEKTDWRITEFKMNEVIAEKTTDGDTVSTNILFSDGHIEFSNPDVSSELREAVEEECKNISSTH